MDVNKTSFYPLLLDILTDVSTSHFVSFDLELSGVPSKGSNALSKPNINGRPSLQQRYLEIKEAAERYQILQIGLTCVQQDVENGKYICRPYNFNLNPVVEERLDIERIFSFQSGAVEFLLRVGFDMAAPFTSGVPYLSREEAKLARRKAAKRQDKSAVPDMLLKPGDTEALALLERARSVIDQWLTSDVAKSQDYINIGPSEVEGMSAEEQMQQELSRFEKRLLHQLVRAEYPELITVSKRGFIQVVRFDQERENRIAAERKQELQERIGRQKGFRWIIEAMAGNDISEFDLRECAKDTVTGEPIFCDLHEYKYQFNRAQALLRHRPRVLVGHNCFLDLVYLYKHFIGDLPDTVEEFQQKLHDIWPVVVDTKYMATHNCGDISPASSLEEIAHKMSLMVTPVVEADPDHDKYLDVEAFHEAGYDSFLTSQIAVRLSAKLEREGAYVEAEKEAKEDSGEDSGGVTLNGTEAGAMGKVVNGVKDLLMAPVNAIAGSTQISPQPTATLDGTNPNPPAPDSMPFTPSMEGKHWKRRGEPSLGPAAENDPFVYAPHDLQHRPLEPTTWDGETLQDKALEGGMPVWGSDFWRVYGNRLRVFGTDEGVCELAG